MREFLFLVSVTATLLFPPSGLGSPRFSSVLERQPERIWAPHLPARTRRSVKAYQQHEKLPNGVVYGSEIRALDLSRLCERKIFAWAQKHRCTRKNDVIKEPVHNTPIHDAAGKTIPLISLLCPDGGVIRLKPVGDPTGRYDRKPEAIKAMRFFGSARYRNFGDEAFKVDNAGAAIPKWPRDLNLHLPGLDRNSRTNYLSQWAHAAHSRLKPCR